MKLKTQKTIIASLLGASFFLTLPVVANDCDTGGKYSVRVLPNVNVASCSIDGGDNGGDNGGDTENPDIEDPDFVEPDEPPEPDLQACEDSDVEDPNYDGSGLFAVNNEQLRQIINGGGLCVNEILIDSFASNVIDVSNVDNMNSLFQNYVFPAGTEGYIRDWNVSNVIDMSRMFLGATAENLVLDRWQFGEQLTHMGRMFDTFTGNVAGMENWNMGNVQVISSMFNGMNLPNALPPSIPAQVRAWDLSSAANISSMFANVNFTSGNYNLNGFDLSNAPYFAFGSLFSGSDISGLDIRNWEFCQYEDENLDFPMWIDEYHLFEGVANTISNSGRPDFETMCNRHCNQSLMSNDYEIDNQGRLIIDDITNIHGEQKSANQVLNMLIWAGTNVCKIDQDGNATVFNDYSGNSINVNRMTDLSFLFQSMTIDQDISGWDVSNADIYGMFRWATINTPLNLSGWDVSNTPDLGGLFQETVFNEPVNLNWKMGDIKSLGGMFRRAIFNKEINIDNLDVSNIENMGSMFEDTNFNGNIGGWDVSNVTEIWGIFENNHSFNQDLSGWCLEKLDYNPIYTENSNWLEHHRPKWGTCL